MWSPFLSINSQISHFLHVHTTCARVRRMFAMNEFHAAEEGESKFTHFVSRNHMNSQQSNKSDNSTVKFKGLDIRSNLVKTLQHIWSKHGNLIEIASSAMVTWSPGH